MLALSLLQGVVDDWSADGNSNIVGDFSIIQVIVLLFPAIVGHIRWRILGWRLLNVGLGQLDRISLEFLERIVGEIVEAIVGKFIEVHYIGGGRAASWPPQGSASST